ncbi:MAG: hypothetical protein JSW11_02185 [Candidatus Heimdallarchaeota archaeon]|nr:MAG: hypothetical protein JSW11_02185 [Candidatus Heimdallarchaeota archaeon]
MSHKPNFLSDYEFEVLRLTNEGMSAEDIARKLKRENPNSIYKTRVVVRKKIETQLKNIAKSLRLDSDLAKIPKNAGLLVSYDWTNDTKVYIIFTTEEGILAWYEHHCSDKCQPDCQETLNLIKRERNIMLSNDQASLPILEQFRYVFSEIQEKGWVKGEGD